MPTQTGSSVASLADEVVRQTNMEREQRGLPALRVDAELERAAAVRARELVGSFSHTRPDGSDWSTVSASVSGENIATVEGASIENGGYLIDINTADARTLETLPGIGEVLAESIVAYREEHGPFASVDELDHVYGIGEGKLEPIRRFLTVEPSQAPKSCTQ